ncbi:MAG: GNAT family N-acetyltransferase [Terriglobia bacterium]
MAALADESSKSGEIVDLRHFTASHLNRVLDEEIAEWNTKLHWDFSCSAALVRKYADTRSLAGFALVDRGEIAGYGYTVLEDHKGLIGDIFVRAAWRDGEAEARIFRALFDSLTRSPGLSRIESQLMLIEHDIARTLRRDRFVRLFERLLLSLDPEKLPPIKPGSGNPRYYLEEWRDHHRETAATVISLAYINHIDARINDQYLTLSGARRFLNNIVEFPGCGIFEPTASFVAFDRAAGSVAGIVLSSSVGDGVAHIAQICVTPRVRGTGLGYELLRHAVDRLKRAGARKITLTVTASNAEAARLYERFGFREIRRFNAYVWEEAL